MHPLKLSRFFLFITLLYFLFFSILSGFYPVLSGFYFFNSWCCILDYFSLNCKLWDKFLISMIILILIISYILIFYRNFELIFEFMALKRAPRCGRNVCFFLILCVFLYLIHSRFPITRFPVTRPPFYERVTVPYNEQTIDPSFPTTTEWSALEFETVINEFHGFHH